MGRVVKSIAGLALAAGLVSASAAMAQTSGTSTDWRGYCNGAAGLVHPDLSIGGCTRMLAQTSNAPADIAGYLTRRGVAYGGIGEFEAALADFRTALTLVPQRPNTLLERAIVQRRKGDLDAALVDIDRFIAVNPDSIDGPTERCRILAVQGRDLDAAEASCNAALTRSPGLWYVHRNRAMLRLRQGRLDAALADFDVADDNSAGVSVALYGRGVIKVKRGQTAAGEADMARATSLTPYLPGVFFAYGLPGQAEDLLANDPVVVSAMAETEGQPFDALVEQCSNMTLTYGETIAGCTALLRLGTLAPAGIPVVLQRRAGLLMDVERYSEADIDLEHLLVLAPESDFGRSRRAYVRLTQKRYDEGIAEATRSVAVKADDAYPYWVRAELYQAKGDNPRAISDLDEAIRLDATRAHYHWMRGQSWTELDSFARAITDFDTAIKLDPDNGTYLNSRCWARALQGRQLDLALADCDASLKIADDPNTLDSRAAVKLQLGDHAGAFADYDSAFKRDPNLHVSRYGRGLALIRLGQGEAGRGDIAAALAADPDAAASYVKMGQTP